MKIGKITDKQAFIIIFLVSCIVLLLPALIFDYSGEQAFLGQETHYDIRMAENVMQHTIIIQDPLRSQDAYAFEPYHYLLGYAAKFFGLAPAVKYLPIICGLITISLIFLLLQKIEVKKRLKYISLLFIISSPISIYAFTHAQKYNIIVPLLAASLYLLYHERYIKLISPFLFMAACFLEPAVFIAALIPVAIFATRKLRYYTFLPIIILSGIIGILIRSFFGLPKKIFTMPKISLMDFLTNNLSIFNAKIGFSFFIIILAAIGFIITWKRKKEFLSFYLTILSLALASAFISEEMKIILNAFMCFFAAKAFLHLMDMRWDLKIIRNLITYIIIAGIIFTSAIYISAAIQRSPNSNFISVASWVSSNTLQDEIMFSHPQNRQWIEFYAQRQTIKWDMQKDIFRDFLMTRNEQDAITIARENEIGIIMADKKTRNLMITDKNNIGLEFVMANSNCFTGLKTSGNIMIWRFVC